MCGQADPAVTAVGSAGPDTARARTPKVRRPMLGVQTEGSTSGRRRTRTGKCGAGSGPPGAGLLELGQLPRLAQLAPLLEQLEQLPQVGWLGVLAAPEAGARGFPRHRFPARSWLARMTCPIPLVPRQLACCGRPMACPCWASSGTVDSPS